MTDPTDFELLELATPYALHAMSDEERADIERRLAAAPAPVAAAFYDEARAVRETLAVVSAATVAEPPEHLRAAVLAAVAPVALATARRSRWRTTVFASAAADRDRSRCVRRRRRDAPVDNAHRRRASPRRPGCANGFPPTRSRHGHADVLPRPQRGCAGDEQCAAAGAGHRLSDVAARGQRPDVGRDDGHRGRVAVDEGDAEQPRKLVRTGIHRRTRHRIAAADQRHPGPAAVQLSSGALATGRPAPPPARRTPPTPRRRSTSG